MSWTGGRKPSKALSRLDSYKRKPNKSKASKAVKIRHKTIHRALRSSLY